MTLTGNILVTGGTGTLGHAILCRAEREGWPASFTIYSRSELLQAQMRGRFSHARYVLGDVRDCERLISAAAGHDTIIHAAAMKRVPECEAQPAECYATNVQGSLNVLRAAVASGVRRVLGISTDKACLATTAYGASKLAMEKAFQAAPPQINATLVRYGNVVASRGSVIPLWRTQAQRGEPLTITDSRMTRFWMSVDDAVDLVLAGLHAEPGTITVAKMHALPVQEMAQIVLDSMGLAGDTRIIGLRSDEKLHEDLLHINEAVRDGGKYFVICSGGERGTRYTSNRAPRLSADAFLAMLALGEVPC